MNIILIGFMGAGKTTVGALLAKRMNFNFYDTDEMITIDEKKEIVEIFDSNGEEYFRDLESKKLDEIESFNNCIFSTGGGIILREENRKILQRNFSVYLKASYEIIFERIKQDSSRPLLNTENPYLTGLEIFNSRKNIYESFQFSVETDNINPELVAEKIYSLYKDENEKN